MSATDLLAAALADLDALEAAGLAAFRQAGTAEAIEAARIEYLGQKQGRVKTAQERLKTLEAAFNFRFSPASSVDDLKSRVHAILDRHSLPYDVTWTVASMPFIFPPGRLVDEVAGAIELVTGRRPALSTSGGTSDGRFLSAISQELIEFGPVNRSIHAVDEHVRVADLSPLTAIYERALAALLARGPN